MFNIPAVLLAGGKSSRMGKDKALLPFKEENSLAQHQYKKLSSVFKDVYIATKVDKFDFKAKLILDTYPKSSALVAMVSAFEAVQSDMIFFLSVDTPFVSTQTITQLVLFHQDEYFDATLAQTNKGLEPLCGLYSQSSAIIAKMHLNQNNHKLHSLLEEIQVEPIHFEDEKEFTNLNTPEEYNKALKS